MTAREFATKFLEDILAFFGMNVTVKVEENEEDKVLLLDIPSTHLNGYLIGQNGDNLRALQHIVNMALRRNGHEDMMVTVDVAGYKQQRNERLSSSVKKTAEEVKETGESQAMKPMSAYDRRVVHKALGEVEGVETESQGEGRDRHIIIKKSQTGPKTESVPDKDAESEE